MKPNKFKDKEKKELDPKDDKFKKKGRDYKKYPPRVKDGKDFKTNDPSWYTKYTELAKNAGSIAFNRRSGTKLSYSVSGMTGADNIDPVMQIRIIQTPGASHDKNSAINIMSNAAWKMLNRRFRGVAKYQSSDFGIIQFGVLDFFANLAQAERVYGVLNYYSLNNTLAPRAILLGLGADPEGFPDLADFRQRLNRLILSAKTLCLVKGYSLLDHYLFLANNVFKDRESVRAQTFAFVREGYWIYDPTIPTGSALRYVKKSTSVAIGYPSGGSFTVTNMLQNQEDILRDLSTQLDALLSDDDVDNVCSDILAFYGNKEDSADIVHLTEVPEDYQVMPIFSDVVCRQVHNLVIIGNENQTVPGYNGQLSNFSTDIPLTFTSWIGLPPVMIYQENNAIQFNLHHWQGSSFVAQHDGYAKQYGQSSAQNASLVSEPFADTDILCPTPDDVIEMTRLMVSDYLENWVDSGVTYYRRTFDEFATIVCSGITFYRFTTQQTLPEVNVSVANVTKCYNRTYLEMQEIISTLTNSYSPNLSRYDWAPMIYTYFSGPNTLYLYGDTDNIIPIAKKELHALHDVACLSEFRNPIMDFLVKEA